MANRPETADIDAASSPSLPFWAHPMRLTKEQLAAAERTREYHVQKLQSRVLPGEESPDATVRQEH